MELCRIFAWDGASLDDRLGGPLHVPRELQGGGRHDHPEVYGALYCSMDHVSSIAEAIQRFRGRTLVREHLRRPPDRALALATFELAEQVRPVDLDDPHELVARDFRPSQVAGSSRKLTQLQAFRIFEEGHHGFLWWSTLEASWINCTLFAERSRPFLSLKEPVQYLTLKDVRLLAAARRLGITVGT